MPRSRTLVLSALLADPAKKWHLRALARETGLSAPTIQQETLNLSDAGIILREQSGNRVYFRANRKCPIYPDLKMLILKTVGLADVLRDALSPLADRIELAYIYGSFAEGAASTESDVDLMVVGHLGLKDIAGPIAKAGRELAREVNPTVYGANEYKDRLREADSFVARVHRGTKITLLGDSDELA
ncbi:nucleotidyltransferase domain-containing protein [bacterium]|nr:nucleotidyltransferase domain-containing protein [bacterium]